MRKLVLKMSVTADSFVSGPNGETDWLHRTIDEDALSWIEDTLWQAGVHIMGSHTFYDMASYWPDSTEPLAAPMNQIPKIVFSRKGFIEPPSGDKTTLALRDAMKIRKEQGLKSVISEYSSTWTNVPVMCGDLSYDIAKLKQQDGKFILAHGGAGFARELIKENLIDEYRLLIHPVLIGSGLEIFSSILKPVDLKLESSTVFKSGIIANIYTPIVN